MSCKPIFCIYACDYDLWGHVPCFFQYMIYDWTIIFIFFIFKKENITSIYNCKRSCHTASVGSTMTFIL